MKIQITHKHIAEGKRTSSHCCPIALALKDAGYIASVGCDVVDIDQPDGQYFVMLPGAAIDFIRAFDSGGDVPPMEIEIELPGKLLPGIIVEEFSIWEP